MARSGAGGRGRAARAPRPLGAISGSTMTEVRDDGAMRLRRRGGGVSARLRGAGRRSGSEARMSDVLLITRAFEFAARKHVVQRRKGEAAEPYVNHLAEV